MVVHLDLMDAKSRQAMIERLDRDLRQLPAAPRKGRRRLALRNHRLAALAFFVVMAVGTRGRSPPIRHISLASTTTIGRRTRGSQLVAHALPSHPLQLFEAPIFPRNAHDCVFRAHVRAVGDGRATALVGRVAGAGPQPADHRGLRAVVAGRAPVDGAMDGH